MRKIELNELNDNVFDLIDKEWMLVCAGNREQYNMMTASWGGLGILWNKPVAFVFVRPERHTFGLLESNELMSLSFLGNSQQMRKIYQFCGSKSGKNVDKMKESGLTPTLSPQGAVCFEQSRLTIVGRKLYAQSLSEEAFADKALTSFYGEKGGMHKMYIVEIEGAYVAE